LIALTANKILGRRSVQELQKASFLRALKAGVNVAFGINASGAHGKQAGPYHGEEAVEFATMVDYGMTPLQAIRSASPVGPENIGWGDRVGSIEKGKMQISLPSPGIPRTMSPNLSAWNLSWRTDRFTATTLRAPPQT
jgi:hypothetical protein